MAKKNKVVEKKVFVCAICGQPVTKNYEICPKCGSKKKQQVNAGEEVILEVNTHETKNTPKNTKTAHEIISANGNDIGERKATVSSQHSTLFIVIAVIMAISIAIFALFATNQLHIHADSKAVITWFATFLGVLMLLPTLLGATSAILSGTKKEYVTMGIAIGLSVFALLLFVGFNVCVGMFPAKPGEWTYTWRW